jgi:hypothetical protein
MLAIQPLRALAIDVMTFPPKLAMELRTAPRTMGARQFEQTRLDTITFPRLLQDPTLCAAWLRHQAARAALTELLVFHRPCHRFAALHGR